MRVRSSEVALLAAVVCLLVASPSPARAESTYVGAEQCLGCHEGVDATLAGTAHGSKFLAEKWEHTCESCHGPGSEHADDPPGASMRVSDLTAAEQSATCTSCHSGRSQFFWTGGAHERRGLSCLSCHAVHAPESRTAQLSAVGVKEQCYTCHQDVRAETWKTSHHPIREGQIGCSDCHNPHGSQTQGMLVAASLNDTCFTCHAEKRGPFLWEHAPVREDCNACHEPHGSNHTKLQITSVPFLCQRCHSNTRHPGTLYDGSRLADGDSASNRAFERACMNCHNAIHGSNHPSSPWLGH